MEILIAIFAATLTIAFLGNLKKDKTSVQLMLLGIELTIAGAVFIFIASLAESSMIYYLLGTSLPVSGLITTIYGFMKK